MYFSHIHIDDNKHYFTVLSDQISSDFSHTRSIRLTSTTTSTLFKFDQSIVLIPQTGRAIVYFTDSTQKHSISHLLESPILVQPNTFFNLLTLSEESHVQLASHKQHSHELVALTEPLTNVAAPSPFKLNRIISATSLQLTEEYHQSLNSDLTYDITFVTSGSITLHLNENVVTLNAGNVIFLPPHTLYQRIHHATHSTQLYVLRAEYTQFPSSLLFKTWNALPFCVPLFDHLHTYHLSPHDLRDTQIELDLQNIMLHLLQHSNTTTNHHSTIMQQRATSQLHQEIMTYIAESSQPYLKVSDLTDKFNISRSTLQQLFQKYEHTSPKQYLMLQRMEKSRQLIRESSLSLTEIAHLLGFGSIQYFSRAFSKHYHMTPSEYAQGYNT